MAVARRSWSHAELREEICSVAKAEDDEQRALSWSAGTKAALM
jgi:hypothetical protein